ncbi:MAG: Rrf2 family transcriptional regulator [Deltaproteobacteria bacterium]|nr:Rrf2 family transcriptional regulator [Deltaproteobacteria bacterium]
MALFSAGARYGLRACLLLADQSTGEPLPGASIAQRLSIPPQYLPVLLHRLKAAGIVATARGQRGGYRLARAPESITVLDVLQAVDGRTVVVPEGGSGGDAAERLFAHLEGRVREELAVSLADAARRWGADAAPMFYI